MSLNALALEPAEIASQAVTPENFAAGHLQTLTPAIAAIGPTALFVGIGTYFFAKGIRTLLGGKI